MSDQNTVNRLDALVQDIVDALTYKAMVVEDSTDMRKQAVQRCEEIGLETIGESSAHQAVQKIREVAPSIVIMDYLFKDEDLTGVQALQQIQNKVSEPRPYTVLWTEYEDDAKSEVSRLGVHVDQVIAKPLLLLEPRGVRDLLFQMLKVQIKLRLEPLFKRLVKYEDFVGNIDELSPIARYKCSVEETELPGKPDGVRLKVTSESGASGLRIFPKHRLFYLKAAYPGAQVALELFRIGSTNISHMRSISNKDIIGRPPAQIDPSTLAAMEDVS